MLCDLCHREIRDHEAYVSFKIPGLTEWMYFHSRQRPDCWDAYLHRSPTANFMTVTDQAIVERKTYYVV